MNGAIAGTEMERGNVEGKESTKGKRNTQVSLEDLSIRRALFSRFGEIGIQFGSPDRKRLVRRGTLNTPLSEKRD